MLIAAALISLPTAASALGTGRAAGTPLTPPAQVLDAQTCLSCHTTISKLHTRGAHKDVNCGSCHTVKAEHFSKPSAANRANGRFQYDDKTGQGKPQEKHWDVIKDMHPENGDQMMGDVIGIGWRPHKGREGQQDSRSCFAKRPRP